MAPLKGRHQYAANYYGRCANRLIHQSDAEEGARDLPSLTALQGSASTLASSLKAAPRADRSGKQARQEIDQ